MTRRCHTYVHEHFHEKMGCFFVFLFFLQYHQDEELEEAHRRRKTKEGHEKSIKF